MGILTAEVKEFVVKQKLGFVATVCPDGTPNLSPKGTTTVWNDDHLIFADIHSPETVANLLNNPSIEINVVDIFSRKGYRFKGFARVLSEGEIFNDAITFYGETAKKYNIRHIVLVKVDRILPMWSPAYDTDQSEEQILNRWIEYWNFVNAQR